MNHKNLPCWLVRSWSARVAICICVFQLIMSSLSTVRVVEASTSFLANESRWHLVTFADGGEYALTAAKYNESHELAGFATFKQWTMTEFKGSSIYLDRIESFKGLDLVGDKKARSRMHWLWKPLIILERLNSVSAGDLVLYSDASIYHPGNIDPKFSVAKRKLSRLAAENTGCDCIPATRLPLSVGWEFEHRKKSLTTALGILDMPNKCEVWNASMTQASWSLWKSSEKSKAFIKIWIESMFQPGLLAVVPYADQSILGLLIIKYNLKVYWWPHTRFQNMSLRDYSSHGNHVKSIFTAGAVNATSVSSMLYTHESTTFDVRFNFEERCLLPENRQDQKNSNKTAICLIGMPGDIRALDSYNQQVFSLFDADVFVVSPSNISVAHMVTRSREPIKLQTFYDFYAPQWRNSSRSDNYLSGLPGFSKGSGAVQVASRWICSDLISREEDRTGSRYDYVGIGRLDLMWMAPHPLLKPLGCWIPYPSNDWGGYCDHWAFCSRDAAEAAMSGLLSMIPLEHGTNIETLLKMSLLRKGIRVKRNTEELFFRSCSPKKTGQHACEFSSRLGMSGKVSGGQMQAFL